MGTNCVQCSDTGVQCNFKSGVFALHSHFIYHEEEMWTQTVQRDKFKTIWEVIVINFVQIQNRNQTKNKIKTQPVF